MRSADGAIDHQRRLNMGKRVCFKYNASYNLTNYYNTENLNKTVIDVLLSIQACDVMLCAVCVYSFQGTLMHT